MKKLENHEFDKLIADAYTGSQLAFTKLYSHYCEFATICCAKFVGFRSDELKGLVNTALASAFRFIQDGKMNHGQMGVFAKIIQIAAYQACFNYRNSKSERYKNRLVDIADCSYLTIKNDACDKMIQLERESHLRQMAYRICGDNSNHTTFLNHYFDGCLVGEVVEKMNLSDTGVYELRKAIIRKIRNSIKNQKK
jgi:hypothetical protein